MFKILTKEESEESIKNTDKFLLSLDQDLKYKLHSLLEPIIKQLNCDHVWIDPTTYENAIPKDIIFCNKCRLIRKK